MTDDGNEQGAGAETEAGLGLLHDIELEATLRFGSREMQLRDILLLGPGDVVELDRHVSEPVDLVVGDRIVALDGEPVDGIDCLQRLLDASRIGRKCELKLLRRAAVLSLTVRPIELPSRDA